VCARVAICAGDCEDTSAGVVLAQRTISFQLTDNNDKKR
jgi:hypothetical protein